MDIKYQKQTEDSVPIDREPFMWKMESAYWMSMFLWPSVSEQVERPLTCRPERQNREDSSDSW